MNQKIKLALLFFPIVILFGYIMSLNYLSSFSEVKIAMRGYDPLDLFSGYYMNMQPDWERTDCSQFAGSVCPKDNFRSYYNFYINQKNSEQLQKAINAEKVELVFSYAAGFEPIVKDMLVDGVSYMSYLKQDNN
ncbi:MAG: hypothetical protein IKN67_02790 [Alphaproteobacteria bacterium]|nr:hypothetical protein [Alphaproteobacteria bacterium]